MTLSLGWMELALRLFAAMVLSGLVGWEREALQRPAGLRTHMLVGVGSALIMMVSASMIDVGLAGAADPGRIAAQVVSGIGFLGAGTILREGISVRGLTTAASLWVVAAIGLAVGAGGYGGALITTAIVLATLTYARLIEQRKWAGQRRLRLRVRDGTGALGEIASVLGEHKINIKQVEMQPAAEAGEVHVQFLVATPSRNETTAALARLAQLERVLSLEAD